ncbi:acyl-CoA N-acyltransferase [Coprinopsis sp. MPI-PUGE-AT-0042]|nr:acyl-CoA N-acyltransferase [Coprinopsis sp. MPI-PUGE-AT-0042]
MSLPISRIQDPPNASPQPKVPQQHANSIRVRPYKDSDGDAAKLLFRAGLIEGPTSLLAAVLRGSLRGRNAILNYFTFLFGALASVLSHSLYIRMSGAILAFLSLIFFSAHRTTAKRVMWNHGVREHADLQAISKYYKISQGTDETPSLLGPDGFWVAVLVEHGKGEGEVVGCVGLDTSIARAPGCAELRRMAVSPKLQRRGIGKMLLEAALTHARSHGITAIWLSTTAHQRSAVGIYEKFGWKNMGPTTMMKLAPFWVDAGIMDWKLELVGEHSEGGNKDWEKMA